MFTVSWLKDALERAIKSFAGAILAVLGVGAVSVLDIDWGQTLGLAGTAALISVLMSIVSAGVGSTGTASLTNAVVPNPASPES